MVPIELPGGPEMILGFVVGIGLPLAVAYILFKIAQAYRIRQQTK